MSYSAIVFNIVAGLIYTPWMIQQIGKSNYGLFVLLTAFLSYFVMDFGLGQTIARFLAKYRIEGNVDKINQILGVTTRLYLYINVVLFFTLLMVYFFISNIFVELQPDEIEKFKVIYIIAGGFSLLSFPFMPLDGVLIAYEKFIVLKLCDIISKVGIIILMVIAISFGYKLYALVAINAVIGIILIAIKFIYLSNTTNLKIDFNYKSKALIKELFKFSFWISVIGIAQRLLINIAPLILGIVSGTTQIALFSIGIIIEGYTWTFAHALNGLFLPKVSRLETKKNNLHEVTNLMIRVGRIQLILMGLLIIGLITLGKEFIILWMGADFKDSYYVMVLLVLPGLITLTQEIAYTYLFVINELKLRAIMFISASVVSVIISFLLAPKYGGLGCAIGIFTATMLCHVIGMNFIYWKVLKLEIPRFFKECYLSMLLPLILTIAFGFLINFLFIASNFVLFAGKIILLITFYSFSIWHLSFRIEEKSFFTGTIVMIYNKIKK